jgi:hypothetical protein
LEGGGRDLIEVLSRYLPGRTEENNDKLSRCPIRNSNRAPPDHKSTAQSLGLLNDPNTKNRTAFKTRSSQKPYDAYPPSNVLPYTLTLEGTAN